MEELQHVFGDHYLVELIFCDPDTIKDVAGVKSSLLQAAKDSGATIIGQVFHQFDPVGVTGVILLTESHFSLHTWPEEGYAALDIFTCGPMFAERAIEKLKNDFKARDVKMQIIKRGF